MLIRCKTKLIVAGSLKEEHNITIDGEKVEQVESFKFLGSTKTSTVACSGDIKSRIAIAKRRMKVLQDIWNDRNLSKDLKVQSSSVECTCLWHRSLDPLQIQ